jgi:hypothetical protein
VAGERKLLVYNLFFKFTICNDPLPRIIRMLGNQTKKRVDVGLRKFEGFLSSAPEKANCGLAVDINHIPDMSTGNIQHCLFCNLQNLFLLLQNLAYTYQPL